MSTKSPAEPPWAPVMESPPGAETEISGRRYRYFAGTSYLGLHGRPEIIEAACNAMQKYGVAAATSRGGFGNNPMTLAVERQAAKFFGTESAFYYASGYFGGTIFGRELRDEFDVIFADVSSHYSLLEGAEASGRPIHTFHHADPAALEDSLVAHLAPGERPLVITDGLFPVLGNVAPLAEYRRVLTKYPGAMLVVDDAHGVGAIGPNGRGAVDFSGLWDYGVNGMPARDGADGPRLFVCGTLSKAFGGYGGFIPGSREFIDRLKQSSHLYNGASPPPTAAGAASATGLEIVGREPELRARLAENVARMKRGLNELGFPTHDTPAPMISITLGDATRMRAVQKDLMARGVVIAYFARYSGVGPEGGLRIAVFATHTAEMIDELLAALKACL